MLTRKEMLDIINGGESVIYKGTIISKVNLGDLPTEAELAVDSGDSKVIEATEASLLADLEKLQNQLNLLQPVVATNPNAVAEDSVNDAGDKKGKKSLV